MRRGQACTIAGGKGDAGKPRPVVVIQDDGFDATDSLTIRAFTAAQNDRNRLRTAGRLRVDKVTTVPNSKVGARISRLDEGDILRLNQARLVFLGLAASPRTKASPPCSPPSSSPTAPP